MKRRFLGLTAAVAAAGLGVLALASCGGGGTDNGGEELEVLALDSLKGKHIEVSFWHSFGHKVQEPLDTLVSNFMKDMKAEGFDIEVKSKAVGGGYDGLRSQVNLGTKSNTIPTMLLGYPDHFADYIDNGILLPLDEYVYNEDPAIALEGVKKDGANDFISSYWAENQMDVNGDGNKQVAGIPFNKSTEIMTYNSNVVDPILLSLKESNPELGIKTEGEGKDMKWVQPTWDQVFAISQYIKDNQNTITWEQKGVPYKIDVAMKYPVYVDSESNFFITTSRQWGGEGKYTTYIDGKGTVVANNSSNKKLHEEYFMPAALDKKLFQFPSIVSQNYGSALLLNRQAFITIGSTAGIKNNTASTVYDLKATSTPQKAYGEGATNAAIQQGTNLAILSKNSNNETRLAAWMLIKYLTSTANTEFFSTETGYLPVRQSARDSESFQALIANENDPFTGAVAKAINAAFTQVDYFYTDIAFNGSSVVRDELENVVKGLYTYDDTFDNVMKKFYKKLEDFDIATKSL